MNIYNSRNSSSPLEEFLFGPKHEKLLRPPIVDSTPDLFGPHKKTVEPVPDPRYDDANNAEQGDESNNREYEGSGSPGKDGTESGSRDGAGTSTVFAVPDGTVGRYADTNILLAREDITQFPSANYIPDDIAGSLRPHAKDFINLAIEKFEAGQKGVLNMDGTGAGKTRQAIGLAHTYLQRNQDATCLIVTRSKAIINDAFLSDGNAMGVPIRVITKQSEITGPGIYITTYNAIKNMHAKLVLFDESHSMKNYSSARTKDGYELMRSAKNVASFSATPIDKATHIGHVCESLGINSFRTMESFGYKLAYLQQ